MHAWGSTAGGTCVHGGVQVQAVRVCMGENAARVWGKLHTHVGAKHQIPPTIPPLYPISYILYPISYILHPISYILNIIEH
jgi:hypothetical protein